MEKDYFALVVEKGYTDFRESVGTGEFESRRQKTETAIELTRAFRMMCRTKRLEPSPIRPDVAKVHRWRRRLPKHYLRRMLMWQERRHVDLSRSGGVVDGSKGYSRAWRERRRRPRRRGCSMGLGPC